MLRRWLSSLLALALSLAPAAAQEFFPSAGPLLGGSIAAPAAGSPTMDVATCAASTANGASYTQTLTFSGTSDGDTVTVVVIALAEDTAIDFQVNSMTFDGTSGTELTEAHDFDVGQGVNTSMWARTMSGAASVSVVTGYSEGVTSNVVCGWAFKGLASATPDTATSDTDTASNPIVLTLGTTDATGFAIGACISPLTTESATWAALTEREDTQHGESDYSNADASATGSSMAVTCDWTGTGDSAGSAAAFH